MRQTTPNVVIVSAARTAVGKAGRGTLKKHALRRTRRYCPSQRS